MVARSLQQTTETVTGADGTGVDRLGDHSSHRAGRLVLDQDVDAERGQDEGVLIGGPARRRAGGGADGAAGGRFQGGEPARRCGLPGARRRAPRHPVADAGDALQRRPAIGEERRRMPAGFAIIWRRM